LAPGLGYRVFAAGTPDARAACRRRRSALRASDRRRSSGARATLALVILCLAWPCASAHASIAFLASSQSSATGTSLVIAKPSGLASGNVEVATIAATSTATITAPSGWTVIQNTTSASSTLRQISYYHVAGASEPSSYTWSYSPSRTAVGGISAYSGVDTTIPVDLSASASGSSGNATSASVTTTAASELVLVPTAFSGVSSLTHDASTTERWLQASGSTVVGDSSDFTQVSAGASAAKTATAGTNTGWVVHTIALRPSGASGVLTLTTAAAPKFSVVLNGADQAKTYTLALTVTDTSGTNAGWKLTVTSTQFTSGAHTLPTTASSVTAASAACLAGSSCTSPTNSLTYPVGVPAGATPPTAVKFFNAAVSSGAGHNTITPTLSVVVPASAYTGSYTSTLTLAIASGP